MAAVSGAYAQRLLMTLFLVSTGVYLFLATVTYTPFDPGWMHISSDTQQVSNASGVAGAWIADLLFGFLGWASLLIPIFLLTEALQVWWPRSFLNRPFRYAAQLFLMLCTASLLYLFWNVPADTLKNASGGIIGYEIGESLYQGLTIYGAAAFLIVLWLLLFTLAYGVKWNKTWATLQATPAYLQDLFYKNVPESESAFDRTTATNLSKDPIVKNAQELAQQKTESAQSENSIQQHKGVMGLPKNDLLAERLFEDMVDKENQAEQLEQQNEQLETTSSPTALVEADVDQQKILEPIDDQTLEDTIAKAHRLQQEQQQQNPKGELWRTLTEKDEVQQRKQEIDELLRAASEEPAVIQSEDTKIAAVNSQLEEKATVKAEVVEAKVEKVVLDWNDDQVFDELLTSVPQNVEQEQALAKPAESNIISYAQSTPFVKSEIQTDLQVKLEETEKKTPLSKEEFIEAWQETAGQPQPEDEFDFDAPLTDAMGRPLSRAMQVAQKRQHLSPLPELELLDAVDINKKVSFSPEQLVRLSELLEIKLQEFNVKAKVVDAQPGPVVTRFELDLAPGVKASKVTNISRDLARSMSMASVRVVEVIPGKPYIGIEVPNSAREMVRLIELLETPAYRDPSASISMAMGKDISGQPVLTDLARAPHMLVAGTTGSGKSVAVNSMILSMLLKYTPDQLRLILIDPKQLELANYNDIPHLLTPVVTDMKDAVNALNWCVNEMERRYKLMSFLKIRKISDYNRKVEEAIANGEDLIDPTWKPSDSATQERAPRLQPLPSIVIVADEFADMIMQVGKKAEEMITRLAQKSRAAGIHLLLATQRPSVDVITGLIKANIPTRVALRVNSKIDSRTILDAGGAEDLLGHGDMLFLGPGKIEPERVHGAFISDDEVNRICDAWRERGEPNYIDEILTPYDEEPTSRGFEDSDASSSDRDVLYDQCVAYVLETRKSSASSLQRKFSLGYNRAARIIDQMEENGILSELGANGKREILV